VLQRLQELQVQQLKNQQQQQNGQQQQQQQQQQQNGQQQQQQQEVEKAERQQLTQQQGVDAKLLGADEQVQASHGDVDCSRAGTAAVDGVGASTPPPQQRQQPQLGGDRSTSQPAVLPEAVHIGAAGVVGEGVTVDSPPYDEVSPYHNLMALSSPSSSEDERPLQADRATCWLTPDRVADRRHGSRRPSDQPNVQDPDQLEKEAHRRQLQVCAQIQDCLTIVFRDL
jgi:hypothetical protein